MLKTNSEKKAWVLNNWYSLMTRGKLSEALSRYWHGVFEEKKNQRSYSRHQENGPLERAKEIFTIDK